MPVYQWPAGPATRPGMNIGLMQRVLRFVPNILSTIRLVLAGLFPFVPEPLWIWLILGSAGTDFLDGWIARRFRLQSRLGAMLDGVADKLFILIALVTVAWSGRFYPGWIPFLLSRDLLVAFTAACAVVSGSWDSLNRMEVRWTGKVATAGQFLMLLWVTLGWPGSGSVLFCSALLSVVAACDYGYLFLQELRRRKGKPSPL